MGKRADHAAPTLHNGILPFYQQHEPGLKAILTDHRKGIVRDEQQKLYAVPKTPEELG